MRVKCERCKTRGPLARVFMHCSECGEHSSVEICLACKVKFQKCQHKYWCNNCRVQLHEYVSQTAIDW